MIPTPTIVRSAKRRRTVALHVEADGTLKVHAPIRTSLGWINDFLIEKAAWIARRRAAIAQRALRPLPRLEDGCTFPYRGRAMTLHLVLGPEVCASKDDGDTLTVALPENLTGEGLQAELKTELTLWYKRQARRVFQERLEHWAAPMGVSPSRLVINAPKRQWGSCNAKNEIRLNWRLIMADPALLDYVVVHELAHIPHKNHGKRFWNFVTKFIPDAKERRQGLKMFNKSPFHPLFS